ncbi:claspin-like [Ylistrum balloti]|uniref:claspin-like n=1 Tax=Ylistrum balloti TaxID=509963 RepID=UPI002905B107|nr:claspin-like [Ylistrum balloti]
MEDPQSTETIQVSTTMKEIDSTEKTDSGMDEDSQHSSVHDKTDIRDGDISCEDENPSLHLADCEDSENEDIQVKPKKRMTRILDDDNNDSSIPDSLIESRNKVTKTAEEVLNAVLNSNDTDEDSDSKGSDNEEILSAVAQKKKKRLQIMDESSNDSSLSGKGTDPGPSTSELKKPVFGNGDLFDAESDSDRDSGDESARSSPDEADDEGFDESAIDPKLLKQLKKGAAKKETVRSQRKAKEEAILSIHSETQRMVRESSANIPYYNPSPRPLQDFLGRALQKQQQYKALKGASHSRKAQLCEEVLSKTRFSSPKLSSSDSHGMEVDLSVDTHNDDPSVSSQLTKSKSEVLHSEADNDSDSLPDPHSNTSKVIGSQGDTCEELTESKTCAQSEEQQKASENKDFDELPELLVEEVKTNANKEEKLKMESSFELQGIEEPNPNENTNSCVQEKKNLSKESNTTEVGNNTDHDGSAVSDSVNTEHKCQTEDTTNANLTNVSILDLHSLPRLSGGPNSFISLDEDSGGSTPKNREISIFMDRFLKHSKKKEKKADQDIQISVIQKEKMAPDREELKENTFTYHMSPVEENPLLKLDTPGAKLLALKSQLSVVMAQKREKNRQKHQQVYDLDNEAGFEGDDEEALLDDEAEMSEHSDTDVEDDEFEEQFGDADEELEEDQEPKEIKNPFVDDEAEDDEESEKDDVGLSLKLQLSDEEEDDNDDEKEDDVILSEVVIKAVSAKKKSRVLQISDDEDSNDLCSLNNVQQSANVEDNAQQLTNVEDNAQQTQDAKHVEPEVPVPCFLVPNSVENSKAEDEFSPFSKHLVSMTTSPTQKKRPNLPPPIEDSQDLYGNNQALPTTQMQSQSQVPFFYLEDSQSQMLDADGFLKVESTDKKNVRSFAVGNTDNAESSDMDELLGLCSGRFAATQSEDKKSCKSLFGTQQTQGNMDELLGLCSGQFAGSGKTPQVSQKSGMKRKLPLDDDVEEEEFRIVSDGEEKFDNDKNELSDDDNDAGNDTDHIEESGDEEDGEASHKFTGFTAGNKHGLIKKDFVDEEAELSGSEYDSDENLDIAEEDDFMEMEEGDKDVTVGEEELRNQVGRAHLKQLIDEDKRELMRFQEMYLQDGDLHSDGAGRKRQFRWRNIDDDTQQDMFGSESEGEKEDEEVENELRWRKERFEREKWLKEQMDQGKEEEESQFLKFGKVFLKRRESDSSNTSSSVPKTPTNPDIVPKRKDTPTPNLFKHSGQKRGSFLSRDKDSLAKIAEFNKGSTVVNPGGPRNSRNLTFQVISPGKEKENKSGNKVSSAKSTLGPKQRKAHTPNTKNTPAAKKPRLEKKDSSFSQNSIFNHI